MNIIKTNRGKVAALVASAVAVALTGVSWGDAQLRYRPVPGGYRANNGDGEFNRPLYGWHGDDRELSPCKSLPWTSDRPKVALKVFRGYRIDKKVRGVLQFGDGTEDVEYRYVWGRAEYDLRGRGTVKMVRSAQFDGLLVEVVGDLPPKFDGEWELAAKGRPVMLGDTAHANAHAIALDHAKELKSLRVECRGTETFVGLLAATLYR